MFERASSMPLRNIEGRYVLKQGMGTRRRHLRLTPRVACYRAPSFGDKTVDVAVNRTQSPRPTSGLEIDA